MKPFGKEYTNATTVRLENRRVTVIDYGDKLHLEFRILDKEDSNPKSSHIRVHDKMTITSIALTKDGAEALLFALAHQLNKIKCQNSKENTDVNR